MMLAIAAVVLLWLVRSILPLVIVSAVFAFLLSPMVTFIARRVLIVPFLSMGARRGLAAVISFLIVLLLITIFLLVLVPPLVDQIEEFGRAIPRLLNGVERQLERMLSEPLTFNGEPILLEGEPFVPLERIAEATGTRDLSDIIQLGSLDMNTITETFLGYAGSLSGPAFSFLGGAFVTIINTIFLIMLTFYMLKDGPRFVDYGVNLVPASAQSDARRIFSDLGQVWNAYLRGQLLLCFIMGMSVYIAALILGVPNAPILGLLAGVLEFIPNIGPFIALIPAAFLGLVSDSATIPFLEGFPFMVVIIITWTGLQNLEAIILVPRIMGDSLNLHPIVVMIAVLSGAALAGPLGVILAAPFMASGRVLLVYVYGKISGGPTFINMQRMKARGSPGLPTRLVWGPINRLVERISTRLSRRNMNRQDPAQAP